jgi:hypothetical protein
LKIHVCLSRRGMEGASADTYRTCKGVGRRMVVG